MSRMIFRDALLVTLCALACACTHPSAPSAVSHIIKHIPQTPAPQPPTQCAPAREGAIPLAGQPRATLYIFTSDWCAACHRALQTITSAQSDLVQRAVTIEQVVIGQGQSCFDAARVASDAPFAYSVAPTTVQDQWGVRSTPTIWLVTPQQEAVLYIEGLPPWDTFLNAIEDALNVNATR